MKAVADLDRFQTSELGCDLQKELEWPLDVTHELDLLELKILRKVLVVTRSLYGARINTYEALKAIGRNEASVVDKYCLERRKQCE